MDGKSFVICCLNLEILVWILLIFSVQLSDETDPGDGKEQSRQVVVGVGHELSDM